MFIYESIYKIFIYKSFPRGSLRSRSYNFGAFCRDGEYGLIAALLSRWSQSPSSFATLDDNFPKFGRAPAALILPHLENYGKF